MYYHLKGTVALACAAVFLAFGLAAGQARAAFVDCNTGGSIQAALDLGDTFVQFTGTCNEFVSIQNNRTVIQGASGIRANDVINGGVGVFAVQGAFFESLTIKGDSVIVSDGAQATFQDTTITETQFGVVFVRGATVRIRRSTLTPALVDDGNLSCGPICVGDNSFARIDDSTIIGATSDPIVGGALTLFRDSSVVLRGNNSVSNSGTEPAIGIFNDSSFRQDNSSGIGVATIDGGIEVFAMSYFDLRQAVVTGNVSVTLKSGLRVGSTVSGGDPRNIVINGNITLGQDSGLFVTSPGSTINGNVTCQDTQSSISGSFQGIGVVSCTDFSGKKIKK